ncbi:MAG: RluA family pseudouridine synthase [Pseudomonadota bacterium]
MSVENRTIADGDVDMRLDRWFRREFPGLGHGRLEKLLRKGQIRVDGRRVKANERLQAGATVRVPPLGDLSKQPVKPHAANNKKSRALAADLRKQILFEDAALIILNKPAGLAVQGGSKTDSHVDGALDGLVEPGAERPRLVHRLDKDTSGVLLLAKTRAAATALTSAFRSSDVEKEYWAICAGAPDRESGLIDLPLAKRGSAGGEKVIGDEDGKKALTDMRLVVHAGGKISWLALRPLTGRTHQLRVHCEAIGCPILGDGKYGGSNAFPTGTHRIDRLHLHARRLKFRHPASGRPVEFISPLPGHMVDTFKAFGFAEPDYQAELWDPS